VKEYFSNTFSLVLVRNSFKGQGATLKKTLTYSEFALKSILEFRLGFSGLNET